MVFFFSETKKQKQTGLCGLISRLIQGKVHYSGDDLCRNSWELKLC